jgi:hypothetical protein
MMTVTCPGCQAQLKVPETLLGRKAKCNKCATVIQIPATAITERATAAAPVGPRSGARNGARSDTVGGRAAARRRPREEEDDEEDDRPRRRRNKEKKSPVLLICVISGLALLLVGGGIGAFFLFRGGSSPSGGGALALLAKGSNFRTYLPDNVPIVGSVRVADIRASGAWNELKREFPQVEEVFQKNAGNGAFSPNDVDNIFVGVEPRSRITIVVFELNRALKESDLLAKKPGQIPITESGFKIFDDFGKGLCLVNEKLLVFGEPIGALRAVLARKGPAQMSPRVEAALADVDIGKSAIMAMDAAAVPKNQFGGMGGGFGPPPGQKTSDPDTVGVEVQAGQDVTLRVVAGYKDANTAQAGKRELDNAKAQMAQLAAFVPKEVTDIVNTMQVTVEGSKVVASTRFNVAPVARSVKGLVGKFGGGPPPFPQPQPFPQPFPQPGPFPKVGENPFPPGVGQPVPQPPAPPSPLGAVPAEGKVVQGQLTNLDGNDRMRPGSKCKRYSVTLQTGKIYQIDMVSNQVDSYLRLEDSAGQQVAQDDDSGGFPNARILYVCPKTGLYTINCTTFIGGVGAFTLTIREQQGGGAPPPPPLKGPANPAPPPTVLPPVTPGPGVTVQGELTAQDPSDPGGAYYKVYTVLLLAGKDYHIEMTGITKGFSTRVRFEDPNGKLLAAGNGFGAGAKVNPSCRQSGLYRIVCTSLPGKTGSFTLSVSERQGAVAPGVLQTLNNRSITLVQGKERAYNVQLTGGQVVTLNLVPRPQPGGRPNPNVTVIVFDAANNTVGQSLPLTSNPRVQFTPAATGTYRVVIRNTGPGTARLTIQQQ